MSYTVWLAYVKPASHARDKFHLTIIFIYLLFYVYTKYHSWLLHFLLSLNAVFGFSPTPYHKRLLFRRPPLTSLYFFFTWIYFENQWRLFYLPLLQLSEITNKNNLFLLLELLFSLKFWENTLSVFFYLIFLSAFCLFFIFLYGSFLISEQPQAYSLPLFFLFTIMVKNIGYTMGTRGHKDRINSHQRLHKQGARERSEGWKITIG